MGKPIARWASTSLFVLAAVVVAAVLVVAGRSLYSAAGVSTTRLSARWVNSSYNSL